MIDIILPGIALLWGAATYFFVWLLIDENRPLNWRDHEWGHFHLWATIFWPVGLVTYFLARVWIDEVWPRLTRAFEWLVEALGD
jgi:hypothetical protein